MYVHAFVLNNIAECHTPSASNLKVFQVIMWRHIVTYVIPATHCKVIGGAIHSLCVLEHKPITVASSPFLSLYANQTSVIVYRVPN